MGTVSGNPTWANSPATTSPISATALQNIESGLDGRAAASHTHDVGDINATGTADGTTYLRGDGSWSTPSGGGVTDHGALTGLGGDDHAQYALADGSRGDFAATSHTHTASEISDSTTAGRSVLTAADAAAILAAIGAAPATQTINAQTGTSYTLVASDAGKLITCTNASAITLTVPSGTFSAGQRVDVSVRGAGMVTVVGSGVTLNPEDGLTLVSRAQYSAFSIVFISSTEADVVGSMAAA